MATSKPRMNRNKDETLSSRKRLGKLLKARREELQYKQQEIADKLGYTYYTFISQIEAGKGRIPPEGIEDWARVLEFDPGEFAVLCLCSYDPETSKVLLKHGKLVPNTSIGQEVLVP